MTQPDDSGAIAAKLLGMIAGGWMSQVIYVAAELKIADLLTGGAKTSEEVALATGMHAPSLHRLMRALVTLEILTQRADGNFELASMGAMLRSDADHSLRFFTIFCGRSLVRYWPGLLESIKTGECARQLLTGRSIFETLERDPQEADVFNRGMVEATRLVADGVAQTYDFSGVKQIVDVGGGYGHLLAPILRANPVLRGIVFDLSHASEMGQRYFREIGLSDRCEFRAGSFFDSVPSGGDAYILKSVIHNWNDERAQVILRHCCEAMAGRGKLILIERVAPRQLEPSPPHRAVALMDLNMLIETGARERTEEEFRALLSSGGFQLIQILPAALNFSLIEATPLP